MGFAGAGRAGATSEPVYALIYNQNPQLMPAGDWSMRLRVIVIATVIG